MEPRLEKIRELMALRQWSESELARKMGVSRSEANRFLNGKRKGGNKVISGLIKAFPDETIESLFFLPRMYPFVTISDQIVSMEKPPDQQDATCIKHPDASQLACTINGQTGCLTIKQGDNYTYVNYPPGPVSVDFASVTK